jgi:hypothetical protein
MRIQEAIDCRKIKHASLDAKANGKFDGLGYTELFLWRSLG